MKILLVESGVMAPEKFVYKCYPPLGLMYLASWTRKNRPQHQFKIYDMMASRAHPEDIKGELESFKPDMVAIHCMTFQSKCMKEIAALVKEWNADCFVAVGGPHPSVFPKETAGEKNVDVIGLGEGEDTFLEIVDALEEGRSVEGIAGTMVEKEGEFIEGPKREFIYELDILPFPAWDLIDVSSYFTDVMLNQSDISNRREVVPIFTSRACPYGCTFCHNMFGKKLRSRSKENVLEEMEMLYNEHGIRELHIIDDCFNFKEEHAMGIMKGIVERGLDLKIAFPNGIRGDKLSEELLDAMVAAGVYEMSIGVESGSQKIQKTIKKGISLPKLQDGISRAARRGIFTHGFFILGFPGENREDMEDTIDFAVKSDLHAAGFRILSPFPGTRIYDQAIKEGAVIDFDSDQSSYSQFATNLTTVDDGTLVRLHKKAHWKFYGNPKRIYRIVSTMPRPMDFFKAGLHHFRLKFLGV